MNRAAFEKLIEEDREWLHRQGRTLERDHIDSVLVHAADAHYAATPEPSARVLALAQQMAERNHRLSIEHSLPEPNLHTEPFSGCSHLDCAAVRIAPPRRAAGVSHEAI